MLGNRVVEKLEAVERGLGGLGGVKIFLFDNFFFYLSV
jgi:hypothetical protein